jgi:virulence-associated protein VapD
MKKLIAQIKAFSGLITSVTVIATATLVLYKTAHNNSEQQDKNFDRVFDSIADIKQTVEYINIEQSMMSGQIYGIQDSLDDIVKAQETQSKQIQTLAWGVKNIERFTPEDFEDIMDEMLKKNSGGNMKRIPLPGVSSIPLSVGIHHTEEALNLYQ